MKELGACLSCQNERLSEEEKICILFIFTDFIFYYKISQQASKYTKSPPNPTWMLCLHWSTEIVLAESEYKSKNFF